ncbi:MAG: hypothetical protein LQ339_003481 [Xanthoria mediterranea]|nr:MAG: hypothetical protein LQ339_003481 [Xanthoria mediterranea]
MTGSKLSYHEFAQLHNFITASTSIPSNQNVTITSCLNKPKYLFSSPSSPLKVDTKQRSPAPSTAANLASDLKPPGEVSTKVKVLYFQPTLSAPEAPFPLTASQHTDMETS